MTNFFKRIFSGKDEPSAPVLNSNVMRGILGEDAADRYLTAKGWRILERNSRPCTRDLRCELDIIALIPSEKRIVFVEVKTHCIRSPRATRLWGISANKKKNLLRASANWLAHKRWHGNYRFDVIEVYGDNLKSPEIDHIENVPLFPPNWRFW